ncbi:MAG: Tetratricopeptide TPR1 repeat-containing, partial [Planctomycetota bacterium]
RAAREAAKAERPDRAIIDKPLSVALSAIEAALRAKPEDAAALRLLEDAATLFEPGDLSRLPRGADGRPILTPSLALRADLAAWVFSCWSPRGLGVARRDRPEASYRLGLFPPPAPPAGAATTPTPFPDPAAPGRVARLLAGAPPRDGEPATVAAWRAAVRAILSLDAEAALLAARSVRVPPDDPFAADIEWVLGAADPDHNTVHWKSALEARPWDPTFILTLWADRRSKSLNAESLPIVQESVRLHPTSVDFRTARAWSLCYTLNFEEALEEAALAGDDPAAHVVAAIAHFHQNRHADCERECAVALHIDPEHVLALLYRAEARSWLRNPKGALEDADAAMDLDPGRVDGLQVRAYARSVVGDRAGAMADCERAIALSPSDPETYRIRGWVHERFGDHARALEDAEVALRIDDRDSRALVLRAMAKLHLGREAEAVLDAEKALQLNTLEARAYVVLGVACVHTGDRARAREHCSKALWLLPGLPDAIRLRAFINASESNEQGTIDDATEVLKSWPKETSLLKLRARARLSTGELKGAMEDCETVLEVNPRSAEALIVRARVKGAMRATGAAIEASAVLDDLDRALALEPKNLEALEGRAAQLSLAGRNREAGETMTKALEISPANVEFRVLRAGYRELAGDVGGAEEFRGLLPAIEPDDEKGGPRCRAARRRGRNPRGPEEREDLASTRGRLSGKGAEGTRHRSVRKCREAHGGRECRANCGGGSDREVEGEMISPTVIAVSAPVCADRVLSARQPGTARYGRKGQDGSHRTPGRATR